jgi:hypothetical protein
MGRLSTASRILLVALRRPGHLARAPGASLPPGDLQRDLSHEATAGGGLTMGATG